MQCGITGDLVSGVRWYLGYSAATVACCGPRHNKSFRIGINDADRQYNSTEMKFFAQTAEQQSRAGIDVSQHLGVRGMSSPLAHLWYLDPATLFIIPFVHMAVHGVFKDFLGAIFAKQQRSKSRKRKTAAAATAAATTTAAGLAGSSLNRGQSRKRTADGMLTQQVQQQQQQEQEDSTVTPADTSSLPLPASKLASYAARRVISNRASGVILHPQHGRGYRDVVDRHNCWTMEEGMRGPMWLAAMLKAVKDGNSEKQLLDPVVKKAYGHLRRYLLFHLSVGDYESQQELDSAADAAGNELLDFARLAQEDFCLPDEEPDWQRKSAQCTFNLHTLLCWGLRQVKERGLTALNLELWLERFLGDLARRTKFRLHSNPERILVKTYLVGCAMQTFRLRLELANNNMDPLILTYDQLRDLITTSRQQQQMSANPAAFDNSSSILGWMQGNGSVVKPNSPEWQQLKQQIRQCVETNGDWSGWDEADWESVSVWQHRSAILVNGEELRTKATRKRDGTYFWVEYLSGGSGSATCVQYAAKAKQLLRIQHPTDPSKVIRVVIADFCDKRSSSNDQDLADITLEGRKGVYTHKDYPVLLETVEGAVALHDRRVKESSGQVCIWRSYLPLTFKSRRPGRQAAKQHLELRIAAESAAAADAPQAVAAATNPSTTAAAATAAAAEHDDDITEQQPRQQQETIPLQQGRRKSRRRPAQRQQVDEGDVAESPAIREAEQQRQQQQETAPEQQGRRKGRRRAAQRQQVDEVESPVTREAGQQRQQQQPRQTRARQQRR